MTSPLHALLVLVGTLVTLTGCGSPGYIVVEMVGNARVEQADRLVVAIYEGVEAPPVIESEAVVVPPLIFPIEQVLEPSEITPRHLEVHIRVHAGEAIVAAGGAGFRWQEGKINRVRVAIDGMEP